MTVFAPAKPEFDFTVDWFSVNIPLWSELNKWMSGFDKFLEIGSLEGRSACWLMQNLLSETGTMVCIDTWDGNPEIAPDLVLESYDRFMHNTQLATRPKQHLEVYRQDSVRALARLLATDQSTFDFIYIDGSHEACDVLTDACLSWPLLKPGGILVFDDYLLGTDIGGIDMLHRPKSAVDAFTSLFNSQMQTVSCGLQYIVRKLDVHKLE